MPGSNIPGFPRRPAMCPTRWDDDACDLVMGYAQGTGLIEDTNPYYHTSYVLIYRAGRWQSSQASTASPTRASRTKTIGIFARTPPASILAMHGLMANAKPFEVRADDSASQAAMRDDRARSPRASSMPALLVGTGRRLLRASAPRCRSTLVPLVKEKAGPTHDLRHHHGRAPERAGMEAQASTS